VFLTSKSRLLDQLTFSDEKEKDQKEKEKIVNIYKMAKYNTENS